MLTFWFDKRLNSFLHVNLGIYGLASHVPLNVLPEVQPAHVKEGEEGKWDIYPWKQKSYGELFFDQVAELENLTPVLGEHQSYKTFSDLHLGEGTSQSLAEDMKEFLPSSPSSANSEDKESSDDSFSSDRDYGETATDPSEIKRKKFTNPSLSSSLDGPPKVLDKRVRNNQASKKFRQLRKGRHKALFDKLQSMENENYDLNVQLEQMMKEIKYLKAIIPEQCASYMSLIE